jgi:hypothetical protein
VSSAKELRANADECLNNTIWMRWRCAAGIFHRSAVLSRRASALLHLTICFPESDGAANHTSGNKNNQQFPPLTSKIPDSSRYGGGIRLGSIYPLQEAPD